jgi:hypothetical protein
MNELTGPFIESSSSQICGSKFLNLTQDFCDELSGKLFCKECDAVFCGKCFEFSHKSEKKKNHTKKEIEENFNPQKCSKHENKKLDLFCVDEMVKCCILCLKDHEYHKIVSISDAKKLYQKEISNFDFKGIYSNFENEIKEIDKKIISKKKELSELELIKQQKVNILNSAQNISNSFKREDNIDTLIEWKSFLKENGGNFEMKLFVCGNNEYGTIGLGEKIKKINHFTEVDLFHNKKIDLISVGSFHTFVYCGKND